MYGFLWKDPVETVNGSCLLGRGTIMEDMFSLFFPFALKTKRGGEKLYLLKQLLHP